MSWTHLASARNQVAGKGDVDGGAMDGSMPGFQKTSQDRNHHGARGVKDGANWHWSACLLAHLLTGWPSIRLACYSTHFYAVLGNKNETLARYLIMICPHLFCLLSYL